MFDRVVNLSEIILLLPVYLGYHFNLEFHILAKTVLTSIQRRI